ncbi:MAG TPA: sulfatase [Vicinamibacteria bacterium]|nr:sulfatase [Vicinamibacteria bacterium]
MRRLAAGALALLASGCTGREGGEPTPAPSTGSGISILLITIDTLRADHLGVYGYGRPTSPRIDALAAEGTVFDQAYTYWPKTRGSFVMMMTGRRPSQNGYSKTHPGLVDFNPSIASVLKAAGYRTAATVDNPNVGRVHGYAKGFDAYRETWEETSLPTEWDRTQAISDDGVRFLASARPEEPFFLWLHYVNPHAPYAPPPPWDGRFTPEPGGKRLKVVESFRGGIPKQWAIPGKNRLADYVALYDGEVAAVDSEVGRVLDALHRSAVKERTLVVLTSDHGESLGEHGYYFDHGEDLFDPSLRIPLVVVAPGAARGRRSDLLASTLDLMPTLLDAAQVSYPPDLAGASLMAAVRGGAPPARDMLFAQNERHLSAGFGRRFKVVGTPDGEATRFALYDREADPGETRDVGRAEAEALRSGRRELELFLERADREWAKTRPLLGDAPEGEAKMSKEACEKLRALGYVAQCAP